MKVTKQFSEVKDDPTDWSDISERITAFSVDTLLNIKTQIDKELNFRCKRTLDALKEAM